MGDKSTDELNKILENVRPKEVEKYFDENKGELKDSKDTKKIFYYYFTDTLKEKRISLTELYRAAGVSPSWGGKIVRMERHTTDRDIIIRLCLAGHFNLTETNRALKLYEMSPLYSRNKRDTCIIIAINNRIYDIWKVDDILADNKQELLSKEI